MKKAALYLAICGVLFFSVYFGVSLRKYCSELNVAMQDAFIECRVWR